MAATFRVTVDDDLARWKDALVDDPSVTIRIYPSDNHLLSPGSGPCTPAEYERAQRVDSTVIVGIADWVKSNPEATGIASE